MTTANIFASWKRLGDAVRDLIALKSADEAGVALSTDDVDKLVGEIVPSVDLAISAALRERALQQNKGAKS